jgi:predicted enzyme related to lactoylglutathione lyase
MAIQLVPELTASMGVRDLDAAIAWYENVLGFSLLYRAEEIGWCEMSTHMPGVNVGLSQVIEVPQGGGATNVWAVADIETAKAELDRFDVKLDGDIQTIPGLVRLVTFYDPDGNAMMLSQTLMEG